MHARASVCCIEMQLFFYQVMGYDGAAEIASILLEQGVTFEFVVDEGLFLLQDKIPNLRQPLAL